MNATAPETTPARVASATYIGRRITTKQKLAHFWHVEGEEKSRGYFKQIAPATIGEIWRLSFDEKGAMYVSGTHKPQNTETFSANREQYVGEDAAAYQLHVELKADKILKNRETDFERALAPLRRLVTAVRTYDDRSALIRRIASELGRTPPK